MANLPATKRYSRITVSSLSERNSGDGDEEGIQHTSDNESEDINRHAQVGLHVNTARFTIPRKPLPQYACTAVEPEPEPDDVVPRADREHLAWRPFYLKLPVLVGFMVVFCALIAGTETIYQVSQHRQGLLATTSSLHYLWTYGPSTVIIVVAAFWARVEYQIKELTPWSTMTGTKVVVQKSILLDYISAFQPWSIVTALRNRHFSAASATITSLLLKVVVVFSTALLILTPTRVEYNDLPITLTSTFNESKSGVTGDPVLARYLINGIQSGALPYPIGVTPDLAYQTFNPPADLPDAELNFTAEAISGHLECEKAEWTVESWYFEKVFTLSPFAPWSNWTYVTCNIDFTAGDCQIPGISPVYHAPNRSDTLLFHMQSDQITLFQDGYCGGSNAAADRRLVIAAAEMQKGAVTNVTYSEYNQLSSYTNVTIAQSAQYICKLIFDKELVDVRVNYSSNAVAAIQKHPGSKTAEFPSGSDIYTLLRDDWVEYRVRNGNNKISNPFNGTVDPYGIDAQFLVGLKQMNLLDISFQTILENGLLTSIANNVSALATAVLTHVSLTQSMSINQNGTASNVESRLVVKELPVRAIEAILALVVLLCIPIVIQTPHFFTVPRYPSTLLGLATLLSRSPELIKKLRGTGSESVSDIGQLLNNHWCTSGTVSVLQKNYFSIRVGKREGSARQEQNDTPSATAEATTRNWQPFVIGAVGRIIACVVLVTLIVVLEVLLWTSHRAGGLADTSLQGRSHYLWAYIPATILTLVALWFGAIDFNMRCLGPYFELKKSGPASLTVGLFYLDEISTTTLTKSVKMRHGAVFASTLAAIIGSTLTIAVSGVYLVKDKTSTVDVRLQANSTWITNDADFQNASSCLPIWTANSQMSVSTTIGGYGSITASLILYSNLSFPPWTYDHLAFPQLSFVDQEHLKNSSIDDDDRVEITSRITGTRANFSCKTYDPRDIEVTLSGIVEGQTQASYLNWTVWDEECDQGLWWAYDNVDEVWIGQEAQTPTPFCYRKLYVWGRGSNSSLAPISMMVCNESYVDVEVDVTFSKKDLSISKTSPPMEDLSTVRPSEAYQVFDNSWGEQYLPNLAPNTTFILPLYSTALYGTGDFSYDDLADVNQRRKVGDTILNIIKTVRAQYLNECTRMPVNATTKSAPFSARYTASGLRLVQDAIATRILDGLLAAMLACTIVSLIVAKTRDAVPKNPCSIVAKASLLADSSLITSKFLPEGAERMSDKRLNEYVDKMRFRMGWFPDGTGRSVHKVDVVGLEDGESLIPEKDES